MVVGYGVDRHAQKAIADLGVAVHAVADDHSPMHTGHQLWRGLGYAIMHPYKEIYKHGQGENLNVWNENDENWNQDDRDATIRDLTSRFGPLIDQIMRGCK